MKNASKALTLDPTKGERAMFIKNNEGDWAILTGRWYGVKKDIPGIKGTLSMFTFRFYW